MQLLPFLRCQVMIQGSEYDPVADQSTVINEDPSLVLELTVCIDKNLVPDSDILSNTASGYETVVKYGEKIGIRG